GYRPPPRTLPGFPDARRVPPKTPIPGGGKRARWKEPDGTIYEWDYQHGTVEKYNPRGGHLGEFDSHSGRLLKPPRADRKVTP
ncbi:MAG: colicin E3/pyocin S6 family cytotoxin, partial [Rudaea sp.]